MKLGIAARLALLIIAVAVVAGGVAGFQVYREGRDRLVADAYAEQMSLARLLAQRLMNTVDTAQRDLALLAGSAEVRQLLSATRMGAPEREHLEDLAGVFERMAGANTHYLELSLVDGREHGLERLRVMRDGAEVRRLAEDELQEKGHLRYVQRGLQQAPGHMFGMPMSTRQGSGAQHGVKDPAVTLVMPIHDTRERALGVVVARVGLVALLDTMRTDLPANHQLFLTNREGDYLAHPDPEQAFAFERGRRARVQDEFPDTALLFQPDSAGSVRVTDGSGREARVATFVRREIETAHSGASFVLGVAQPVHQAMIGPQGLAAMGLRMLPAFGVIAVLLAFLVARAATRSLRELAAAAGRLGEPGGVGPLPVTRGDEIGELARSLHATQGRIAQTLSQLEASRGEMMHLARHDPLTGLPNRLLFHERVEQAIARANRNQQRLALLLIDLDAFKPVNDQHGHAAGDHVLRTLAGRMRECVREVDTVARFGGDEFVILLEGLAEHDAAAGVAQKLVAALAEPVPWEGVKLVVGASVGVAFYPLQANLDSLALAADTAMYRAKAAGGGCYRYFEGE